MVSFRKGLQGPSFCKNLIGHTLKLDQFNIVVAGLLSMNREELRIG